MSARALSIHSFEAGGSALQPALPRYFPMFRSSVRVPSMEVILQ